MAQAPTPFGTPSLLPTQNLYPAWQSSAASPSQRAPALRTVIPAAARPANVGYLPPASFNRPTVPMPYAASRTPHPAAPVPYGAPVPNETLDRGLPHYPVSGTVGSSVPSSHGVFAGCDDGCCWETPVCCDPCCDPCCGPSWYAGVGGLLFTRNRPRFSQISFDDTNLVGQVLSTDTGLGHWDTGPQVQLGWYVSPCWALELNYWGIYAEETEAIVYAADLVGNLNTVFDFRPLNIGADNVNDLFDAAQAHRIHRDYEIHNFELNMIGGRLPWMEGSCLRVSYLAGLRDLRFTEDFHYGSADANPVFGADLANEAYYDIDVRNNLWGCQLGGRADWFVTPQFSLYAAPKFGIYANYMEHRSEIYNVNGVAVVGPGNPLSGDAFDIASNETLISFIGELDLGLSYQFRECWSAAIGYRAIAVSGLAFATDQIPRHFADLPGVVDVDGNADMILHGGYAAITLFW